MSVHTPSLELTRLLAPLDVAPVVWLPCGVLRGLLGGQVLWGF